MHRERIEITPTLDREGFFRRSGAIEEGALQAEAEDLFRLCARQVRPKALLSELPVRTIDENHTRIGEERFESRCLVANLADLATTCVFVATCGTELEEIAAEGDGLRSYWVDLIKELALESVIAEMNDLVSGWFGSEGVAMMNPGSADADVWPIEEQRPLFRLLGDTRSAVGVTLTASLLMIPNKSVSGVLFPSRSGWVSCETCTRRGCIGRRAPYRNVHGFVR